ncbi:hypothetical protein Tco_1168366, partial [Tanacetum coccineum]
IVTEASVRHDLQLDDEEGTDCLPNATIFEELTRIGYEKLSQKLTFYKAFFSPQWKFLIHTVLQCLSAKTTAWNEFSITMATAIIYLATNQKFNFSKYIFKSMVKNLDNAGKFLMYLRFVQVFLDKQLEGMQSYKRIYDAPCHTKKIFRNMKRVEKGFSRRETPLFPTMVVQAQEEIGEGSAIATDPHHTPIQPSTSQPQNKQRSRKPKRKDTEVPQPSGPTDNIADEAVYKEMNDSLVRAATTATGLDAEQDSGNINKTQSKATPNESSSSGTSSGGGPRGNTLQSDEDSLKLQELIEFCTKLQQRVLDLENTKTAQAQEIKILKLRVKKLDKKEGQELTSSKDYTSTIPVSAATTTTTIITNDEITLAKALAKLKSAKLPTTTAATTVTTASTDPKLKASYTEEEASQLTPTVFLSTTHSYKLKKKKKKGLPKKNLNKLKKATMFHDNVQSNDNSNYQMAQQIKQNNKKS